jgi:hypothetical protein
MQDTQASCGPAAMSNALQSIGIQLSVQACEKLCHTSAVRGTQPAQLRNALTGVPGITPVVLKETRWEVALMKVLLSLQAGRPVILCVDSSTHWIAAVGTLGIITAPRLLTIDSADLELVLSYTPDELMKRWGPNYYGVIL